MTNAIPQIKQTSIIDFASRIGLDIVHRNNHSEACCPKCQETGGRHLYLYPDNRFHCFKCGSDGDIIDLYRITYNCTSKEAIEAIKQSYGYNLSNNGQSSLKRRFDPLEAKSTQIIEKPKVNVKDKDIQAVYYDFAADILTLSDTGRQYLHERGISDKTINRFQLLSIDDPAKVKAELLERFNLDILLKSGLFYLREGVPQFAFYQKAIVFTHFVEFYVSGFTTRNLAGDIKSFKLHGLPSPLFEGYVDVNTTDLYVTEGVINALSLLELTGSDNFIALSGLITPGKYRELQRLYPNVNLILAMDADEAGQQALNKIAACDYLDLNLLVKQLGYDALPKHDNGKAFDVNDILVNELRKKDDKE